MRRLSHDTIRELRIGSLLYCRDGKVIGLVSDITEEIFFDLRWCGFQLLRVDVKEDFFWESCLIDLPDMFF